MFVYGPQTMFGLLLAQAYSGITLDSTHKLTIWDARIKNVPAACKAKALITVLFIWPPISLSAVVLYKVIFTSGNNAMLTLLL